MNKIIENIDRQIKFNQNKNIFFDNPRIFQFVKETGEVISGINSLNQENEQLLINYATEKSMEEFCRVNQYYSIDTKSKSALREIYYSLFTNIKERNGTTEEIAKTHYENLKKWLKESNPFAEMIYTNADEKINPVACSEYSPELQIDILQLDTKELIQPILDIGCGSKAKLVNYLREAGIEAYGIDRYKFSDSFLLTSDWLENDYGKEKWGTIISNLGFSNHFTHHNLREDGNYEEYGKTYMKILNSLKIGGSFHYAPDLPFIENYLNQDQFILNKQNIQGYAFSASIVKRIS